MPYLEPSPEGLPGPRGGRPRRGRGRARARRCPASTPSATLQTKLVVGAAGDAFEREADRVADELMRRAAAGAAAPAPGADQSYDGEAPVRVSRQTAGGLEKGTPLPPEIAARVERMRAGGVPLPARARALFEPLLGVDLGSIRIHTGLGAIQTARRPERARLRDRVDIAFGFRPVPARAPTAGAGCSRTSSCIRCSSSGGSPDPSRRRAQDHPTGRRRLLSDG